MERRRTISAFEMVCWQGVMEDPNDVSRIMNRIIEDRFVDGWDFNEIETISLDGPTAWVMFLIGFTKGAEPDREEHLRTILDSVGAD